MYQLRHNLTCCTLALVPAMACSTVVTSEGEELCSVSEVAASTVPEPPANPTDVMAAVPTQLEGVVQWDRGDAPLDHASDTILLTLARTAEAPTIGDRGTLWDGATMTQECAPGSFLRIRYDGTVHIGDNDVVATGPILLQADDTLPPTLILLSSGFVFPVEMWEATLSSTWSNDADLRVDPAWDEWERRLTVSGPLSALGVSVLHSYEEADGTKGLSALWHGDLDTSTSTGP